MKKFKNFMTEGPVLALTPTFGRNPAAGGFGDPAVLKKINGLLGRMCMENSNSADLEPVVRQIRSSLSKMGPDELITMRDFYKRQVTMETRKERIRLGFGSGANILPDFRR